MSHGIVNIYSLKMPEYLQNSFFVILFLWERSSLFILLLKLLSDFQC